MPPRIFPQASPLMEPLRTWEAAATACLHKQRPRTTELTMAGSSALACATHFPTNKGVHPMTELNLVLAECKGQGRIHLCSCESIHLTVGPVTVSLTPAAFAQTATMIREAMEQLARMDASQRFEEDPISDVLIRNQFMN